MRSDGPLGSSNLRSIQWTHVVRAAPRRACWGRPARRHAPFGADVFAGRYEASMYFGNQLLPFIPKLANSDGSKPFAEQTDIDDPLRSAIIT